MSDVMESVFPHATEDEIARIKEEHPICFLFATSVGDIILRGPTRGEWGRFRATIYDERKRALATEQLARDCILFPNREAVAVMFDRKPVLAEKIAERVMELGGQNEDAELKPL